MSDSDAEITTRIALVEREVNSMSSIFTKLDATLEKMADVSASIKEMLAVHDSKINKTEEHTENLYSLIEKRRTETEIQHSKIQQSVIDTEKKLKMDMDDFQKTILSEMKDLRKELKEYHEETQKVGSFVDRGKLILSVIGVLIAFILYKMNIIPFIVKF